MSYLGSDLLRARKSAALKSQICEKSTLQIAQTNRLSYMQRRLLADIRFPCGAHPHLLRARDSAASKPEVCEESSLQTAQAVSKEKLAGIVVDLAAPVLVLLLWLRRLQESFTSHTNDTNRTTLTALPSLITSRIRSNAKQGKPLLIMRRLLSASL